MALTISHVTVALQSAATAVPASPAAALLFAALTGLGMLAGIWAIRRFESWAIRHTAELVAFAAGLLVAGALLHLVPESADLVGTGRGLAWTLAGFLVLYLVEAHFLPHVHRRGELPIDDHHRAGHAHHVGPLVILGLAIHSLAEGVSVGAGLSARALIGTVAAALVVFHKLPVGIAAMSALYHSGVPGRRAAWVSSGLALITPLAVVVSYFTLRGVSEALLGILLGLAGGSFLYIGAADLLPEGQAHGRPVNTLMFVLGSLAMVAVKLGAH
ncbi:MAG: hypothetical protein AMS25_13150 [Gemmatimonas sp. SM23_52]|nr:MAG: hypothetical protein AMS25_13150 [Gemmatimonas sp. SM23_52]